MLGTLSALSLRVKASMTAIFGGSTSKALDKTSNASEKKTQRSSTSVSTTCTSLKKTEDILLLIREKSAPEDLRAITEDLFYVVNFYGNIHVSGLESVGGAARECLRRIHRVALGESAPEVCGDSFQDLTDSAFADSKDLCDF